MATTVFPKPSGWASATEDIPFTIAVTDWTAAAGGGYQAEIVNTKFNVSSIELITYTVSVAEYLTANISKTKDAANNKLIFLTDSLPTGPISGNICCINNLSTSVSAAEKGVANGVASLDSSGKVPAQQLPSYVDDVLEYASQSAFPATGESGKIYVAINTSKSYRWSGSAYVELSSYETATQSASGLMSATDKTKLDGIATGATANVVSDSLSDTSTTNALSAAKGKALNDSISTLNSKIATQNIGTFSSLSALETVLTTLGDTLANGEWRSILFELSNTTDVLAGNGKYIGLFRRTSASRYNLQIQCALHAYKVLFANYRDSIWEWWIPYDDISAINSNKQDKIVSKDFTEGTHTITFNISSSGIFSIHGNNDDFAFISPFYVTGAGNLRMKTGGVTSVLTLSKSANVLTISSSDTSHGYSVSFLMISGNAPTVFDA